MLWKVMVVVIQNVSWKATFLNTRLKLSPSSRRILFLGLYFKPFFSKRDTNNLLTLSASTYASSTRYTQRSIGNDRIFSQLWHFNLNDPLTFTAPILFSVFTVYPSIPVFSLRLGRWVTCNKYPYGIWILKDFQIQCRPSWLSRIFVPKHHNESETRQEKVFMR